jgi:hypothetical protein
VLATAFGLKVFFSVVAKEPKAVTAADVLDSCGLRVALVGASRWFV